MNKYLKALTAFLVYGASQLLCGWLIVAALMLCPSSSHPLTLSLCLMASGALAVLLVWQPLGMIRGETSSVFSLAGISPKGAATGLVAGLSGMVALNIMSELANLPDTMTETLIEVATTPLGAITVCIVGPLCEELVFREGIQGHLHRHDTRPAVAIIMASLLFGILHFNPAQTFFASLMGIILGILYYRTGSAFLCSLLHIINNLLAVVQMWALGQEATDFSLCHALGGKSTGIAVMVVCGIASTALLSLFWRSEGKATRWIEK